jgi:hypothetical protein
MNAFGQTLFAGSRFIRWTLTPFVLLFAVVMPLLVEKWTLKLATMIGGMEFFCIALLAGFWLPVRIGRWAFRSLGAAVFLVYAGYLIDQVFFTDTPFRLLESRSESSPRNALLGFVIIGLPSLWYALFGRFTVREAPPEERMIESDDDAT